MKEVKSSTNSELGSYHWYHTIVGRILRIGEFIGEKTPDEATLRIWGKDIQQDAKELINGYQYINKQDVNSLAKKLVLSQYESEDHPEYITAYNMAIITINHLINKQ